MVLLTVTPAAGTAIEEYVKLRRSNAESAEESEEWLRTLSETQVGSQIDHGDLLRISKFLVGNCRENDKTTTAKEWRLETLLRGASIYQPPPPPKPEPVRHIISCGGSQWTDFSKDTSIQSIDGAFTQGRRAAPIRAHG